jgi:hypothetical protein
MTWLVWLWNYTWVGALVIFAIVYVLGFWSGASDCAGRLEAIPRPGGGLGDGAPILRPSGHRLEQRRHLGWGDQDRLISSRVARRCVKLRWTQFGPAGMPIPPRYEPARPCRAFHPSEKLSDELSGYASACCADLTAPGPKSRARTSPTYPVPPPQLHPRRVHGLSHVSRSAERVGRSETTRICRIAYVGQPVFSTGDYTDCE